MERDQLPLDKSRTRIVLRTLIGFCLALTLYVASGTFAARSPSHSSTQAVYSLFALGDTGKVHRPLAALLEGQMAVAGSLEMEAREHPADAILILGDTFYMEGLKQRELVPRLRQNIVRPYCYFLELDGARSSEVASACDIPAAMRQAIPIHAVLGNHDYVAPESPRLQREVIPQFVPNWNVHREFASVRELTPGLSLVLFSSEEYTTDKLGHQSLVSALRKAKGPWRILAAHTPMSIGEDGDLPNPEDLSLPFQKWVQAAIGEAGVAVQLYVSGHHHSLQVIEGEGALGPALHMIVGSGARYRRIELEHPRRRYQAEKLGFGRIDLVDTAAGQRLVASIFRAPTIPLSRWGSPGLATRWSIELDGGVERLR